MPFEMNLPVMIDLLSLSLIVLMCIPRGSFGICEHRLLTETGIVGVTGEQRETVKNGVEFCSFLGIPYGIPPLGKYRFKEPSPINFFHKDYWDLRTVQPECHQLKNTEQNTSEDCLYLNIFTPLWNLSSEQQLSPVLIWIHGGSFIVGSSSSDDFKPDGFVEENIIVVSFNYRLDFFGFFPNYPEENYPNNVGLLDQKAVINWVNRYISHFNGDPNQVTLMGWSAGSASIHYHLYDESLTGTFQKAISMSGSFLNAWSFNYNPFDCRHRFCIELLNFENCSLDQIPDDFDFSNYIQTVFQKKIYVWNFGTIYPCFGPTLDLINGEFYPQEKMRFYLSAPNDVPLLIGLTNKETKEFNLGEFISESFKNYKYPNQDQEVISQINEFLFQVKNVSEESFNEILDQADMYHGIGKFIDLHSQKSKEEVFVYKFYYTRDGSEGASHGDDLKLLFQSHLGNNSDLDYNKHNDIVSDNMIQLWSDFIKFGNPTAKNFKLKWPPFSSNQKHIMQIKKKLQIGKWRSGEMYKLFDRIYNCLYFLECSQMYRIFNKWRLDNL